MINTPKNYVYRMHHDVGFAPNVEYGICTLSGCKKTTIEKWAKKGSWVIGIGGKNTHKPNKLIYAMEVEENLKYGQFKEKYPNKSRYLQHNKPEDNVLVSSKFFYFGNNALNLPEGLKHIIINRHGCKCVSDEDLTKLKNYLKQCGHTKYGVYGKPNNPASSPVSDKCSCNSCVEID